MNSFILLEDNKQNERKYQILFSFTTDDNKEYIIYTDNDTDESGLVKVYAGKKENENLIPVKDDDELQLIEKFLDKLDKEC